MKIIVCVKQVPDTSGKDACALLAGALAEQHYI